ncbi:MAG: hypothetical protein M0Z49_06825 [Chloroflexi bacterium]|nr:hypothetical protein [Chloroflexota bacterium]
MRWSDHDVPWYWEQRGWDEQALVRTYSRIDFPAQFATVPAASPFTVYGVAFGGARGISKVEASPDAGHTWLVAELEPIAPDGPVGALTWRPWRARLTVRIESATTLLCWAADGEGRLQDPAPSAPLSGGATGHCAEPVTALRGMPSFWPNATPEARSAASSGVGAAMGRAPAIRPAAAHPGPPADQR